MSRPRVQVTIDNRDWLLTEMGKLSGMALMLNQADHLNLIDQQRLEKIRSEHNQLRAFCSVVVYDGQTTDEGREEFMRKARNRIQSVFSLMEMEFRFLNRFAMLYRKEKEGDVTA